MSKQTIMSLFTPIFERRKKLNTCYSKKEWLTKFEYTKALNHAPKEKRLGEIKIYSHLRSSQTSHELSDHPVQNFYMKKE